MFKTQKHKKHTEWNSLKRGERGCLLHNMVKWSSFLVSEWFDLLFSIAKVTIVLEPYRRKWQGGNMVIKIRRGFGLFEGLAGFQTRWKEGRGIWILDYSGDQIPILEKLKYNLCRKIKFLFFAGESLRLWSLFMKIANLPNVLGPSRNDVTQALLISFPSFYKIANIIYILNCFEK